MSSFSSQFKKFIVSKSADEITIIHNIKDEYKSGEYFGDDYTLDMFKDENVNAYKLGESYGMCKIISYNNKKITTSMPFYKPLLDNIKDFDINKLIELIKYMETNQIYSDDFAFRNIGVDKNGDYKLLDLCSLTRRHTEETDEGDVRVSYDSDNKIIHLNENYYIESDLRDLDVDLQGVTFDVFQLVK
jgi:hypothetical protein